MSRILVIDDEQVIRNAVRRLLERNGYQVEEAASIPEAIKLQPDSFDLVLADLRLPGEPGTDIIAHAAEVPTVIMTSYASVRSAVESMKQGAVDYISKPFDHDEMLLLVARVLKQRRVLRQNAALKHDLSRDYPILGMVGECEQMQAVFNQVSKVAPTDMTVLILGESGTGKELVARALHEQSKRLEAPLIAVNCAAIPEGLIESELFGHEKGAFTGAINKHEGLIEAANGGTLFLDEVGELPAAVQVRLLRVLENSEIRPVGSTSSRLVDIRLVGATHRDLSAMVANGEFREDLFYRLRVMEITLPPLRERQQDIMSLANFMLDKTSKELNLPTPVFSEDSVNAIRSYAWPGNVRELENAIERALILAGQDSIHPHHLGLQSTYTSRQNPKPAAAFNLSMDEYFRRCVIANQNQYTETELAKILGISRKALWERRQRMDLPRS